MNMEIILEVLIPFVILILLFILLAVFKSGKKWLYLYLIKNKG